MKKNYQRNIVKFQDMPDIREDQMKKRKKMHYIYSKKIGKKVSEKFKIILTLTASLTVLENSQENQSQLARDAIPPESLLHCPQRVVGSASCP